jgi:hypothetical protein
LHTDYIYLFLVDPRTNSEYFPVRINNIPVFITETGCVLCAVGTGRLNIIWVKLSLYIVCVLLGTSPASDCDLPTFRNPLSVPSSKAGCRVLSA